MAALRRKVQLGRARLSLTPGRSWQRIASVSYSVTREGAAYLSVSNEGANEVLGQDGGQSRGESPEALRTA